MRRGRRPAQALRGAIDCMPLTTRIAMRDALAVNSIIVGAYTDRDGGVCPMLAAHRNGGRTSFAAFARAWDRYTRAGRTPRPATEREVRALAAMLDASIATETACAEETALGGAIAAHRATQDRRARADTGERNRTSELERRHGWAWLRPFRRLDDYERAVEALGGTPAGRRPVDRQPAEQR